MRVVLTTLLALLLTGLLSACGGSGGGDAAPSPKDRFVARADGLCGTLAEQTRKLAETTFAGAVPSDAARAAYEQRATSLQRGTLAKLRALTPPPGDEARVTALLDALEASITAITALDPQAIGGPTQAGDFETLARGYGLKVCGGTA